MARTTRSVGPFSRAKTGSTAARAADLRALAGRRGAASACLAVSCGGYASAGHGRRGISHWPLSDRRYRPRHRRRYYSDRSVRAATPLRDAPRRWPPLDQAVAAVDADVVLMAEGGDREIDARHAVLARPGLGGFDRPARLAVLLPRCGGLVRPLRRDAAFLDVTLLALGVALLWRGDDRGVDNLPAPQQKPRPNPVAESAASKRSNRTCRRGCRQAAPVSHRIRDYQPRA